VSPRPYFGEGLLSVPDAYEEYLYWARIMAAEYGPATRELYSCALTCEQARQAWIAAEWRVNCASWRWLRAWGNWLDPLGFDADDNELIWIVKRQGDRRRFATRHFRGPGSDLVLRDKGMVACRS